MAEREVREYSNGEVTILWDSSRCIHAGRCVRGLPQVFDVHARPWINMMGATSEEIVAQVAKCPSAALSMKNDSQNA